MVFLIIYLMLLYCFLDLIFLIKFSKKDEKGSILIELVEGFVVSDNFFKVINYYNV